MPTAAGSAFIQKGPAWCQPYVLDFVRTIGDRVIFNAIRNVDHDPPGGFGCGRSRTTRILVDGGRAALLVSENSGGTLRFQFSVP